MTTPVRVSLVVSLAAGLLAGCTTPSADKAQIGFNADDRKFFREEESKLGPQPNAPKNLKPAESFLAMGQFYLEAKRMQLALRMFEKAIETDPKLVGAYAGLAKCHADEGRIDQAAAALDKGFAVDAKSACLWNEAAVLRAKTGDMDGALEAVQRAAATSPNVTLYAGNYVNLLAFSGRYQQALDVYTKTLGDAEAHYRLGLVLNDKGDRRRGQEHLKQALALDPEHASARRVLAAMDGAPLPNAAVQRAGYEAPSAESQPIRLASAPRRANRSTAPQWVPK